MKDSGMSDGWYSGLMMAANVAAIAINIVGVKQCFKEGTLVACLSEEGVETYKPIEDVKVGDMVLAYDEETREQAWKPVVQLFRGETKEWYHVFVDGEEIICTADHPFYVFGKGFVSAKALTTKDKLVLANGQQVKIDKIKVEKLTTPETRYNFEVADFHTYYVSEKAVLVHNFCEKNMPITG